MNEPLFQKPSVSHLGKERKSSASNRWRLVLDNGVTLSTDCEGFVTMLLNESRIAMLVEN